jgi:Cu+-exporting ATPase
MKKVVALAFLLAAVGCGGAAPSPSSTPAAPAGAEAKKEVKPPGEAKPGDTSRCPVSGEEFDVTASSPHAEHNGKTYYFCCTGCEKKFKADPSKFLNKS